MYAQTGMLVTAEDDALCSTRVVDKACNAQKTLQTTRQSVFADLCGEVK